MNPELPSRPVRPPTIYDVAKVAGVAASTVSRTFSRPARVNAETAQRVRVAAKALGYRTNPLARALPTGRTSIIAVIVSDITNPFHFEIIHGAQAAAAEAGYTMILADAQESDALEREALDRAIPTVEGIVLASTRMTDSAIRMIAKQRPMVVLNRWVTDVPSLVTDNPHGVKRAAEHLAGLGHRTITYVAGPEASWADGIRWLSLRDVATRLDLQTRRIGPYQPTVAGGERAAADLESRPPTAILAYNDQLAIGLIRGFTARGTVVPDEVSIVGFDNIFAADLVTPRLTTVASPLNAMGRAGVHSLLAIINGAELRLGEPMTLPTRLVERESTSRQTRRRPPDPTRAIDNVRGLQ